MKNCFYQNCSNYSAFLKEYRRFKGLKRRRVCVHRLIKRTEVRGELGKTPGTEGRRALKPNAVEIVE